MASTENIIGAPSLLTKTEYGKGVKTQFYEKGYVAAKRNANTGATKANVKAAIGS